MVALQHARHRVRFVPGRFLAPPLGWPAAELPPAGPVRVSVAVAEPKAAIPRGAWSGPRQGERDSPAAGWVAFPLPAAASVLFRELTSGEASPRKVLAEKAVTRELLLQRH